MEFLGILLDPRRNQRNEPIITEQESRVIVRVIKTNEDLMIARQAGRFR